MKMGHRLVCRRAVVENVVEVIAINAATADGGPQALAQGKEGTRFPRLKIAQILAVSLGNHQEVTWAHRVDVQEGQKLLVLVDPMGWGGIRQNLTEYAGSHVMGIMAQGPGLS